MLFHEPTNTIYNWIKQQPHVKEESITDWLLFELSKRCLNLKYYAFTHHEEKNNGADWEWWVLTVNYAYRFRVQAKKIKPKADNYPSVCYSNNTGVQIDLLRNDSKSNGAFPLYMFYSGEEQDVASVLLHYPCPELQKMVKWCSSCLTGAFLSPAELVYNELLGNPKRRVEASTLLNISLKLSCFDMIFPSSDTETISITVEQLLNTLNESQINGHHSFRYKYNNSNNRYDSNTVPHWLSFISGEKQSNVELSEWFESEYKSQLPNVAGVVVLDLRQCPQK